MVMRKSCLLWLGLLLIAAATLWHSGISSYWRQRFPTGWAQEFNFIGISTLPDLATGQFPPTDDTGLYQRIFQIVARSTGRITLQDQYIIRDPLTDEITYNYTFGGDVDARTGAHLDPLYRGDYYLFPREVKRTTYRIRHSYLEGIPLAFQYEEDIEGILTYLFAYRGDAEYTASYLGLQDSLGRSIETGQEVRCADEQFRLDMWVEPVTGEIVKIDESCYAGDYVYDVATGQQLFPVLRWGAVTAGDDVQERSIQIRIERATYLWATRYFPLLLVGAGMFSLFLYAAHWRTRGAGDA